MRHTPHVQLFLLAASLFALPSALAGQGIAIDAVPTAVAERATPQAPRGPVAAPVGFDRNAVRPDAPVQAVQAVDLAAAVAPPREGTGVALMVVGVAALLAGLLIEGDAGTAVAIGGAVLGLVGLFQYLR